MKTKTQIRLYAKKLLDHVVSSNGTVDAQKATAITHAVATSHDLSLSPAERIALLKEFQRHIASDIQESTLSITTAKELSHDLFSSITKQSNYPYISYNVNPDIIGGVIIQSGWDVLDSSISHSLHTLHS